MPAGSEIPSGGDEGKVAAEAIRVGGVWADCELALVAVPEEGGVEGRRMMGEVFEFGGFPGRRSSGLEFGEDCLRDGGVDLLSKPGKGVGGEDGDLEIGGAAEEFRPIDGRG